MAHLQCSQPRRPRSPWTPSGAIPGVQPLGVQSRAMPRRQSAGTLLYRLVGVGVEVLLVHPSGGYNRKAPWGLPKGEPDEKEELEAAARRETTEETGVVPGGLTAIGYVDYKKSSKRVFAFTGLAPQDATPTCTSWEVDRAEFVPMARARKLIHPDHVVFLDRLEKLLKSEAE